MRRGLVLLLVISISVSYSPLLSQASKEKRTVARVDTSKAQIWAQAVTDFVADPRLAGTFREAEVAQRLKALIPPTSLKVDHDEPNIGFGRNPEKGIAGVGYRLAGVVGAPNLSRFGQVSIFLSRTDPDGVDVLSQVMPSMKQKLRPPWHGYPVPGRSNGYYWDRGSRRQQIIPTVSVDVANSDPGDDGTPNEGPWVVVRFAIELRVDGEDP